MNDKPRKGRRPKPAAEKQSAKFLVSLTPTEYAEVQAAAGEKPIGTWARAVLTRAAKRARVAP